MRGFTKVWMAAPVVALALGLGACGSDSEEESDSGSSGGAEQVNLKIGFSAALTGPYAAYDQPLLNGMQFAADQINGGAIPGVKVEILSKDNKGEQTLTATTTQELIDGGAKVHVLTTGDTSVAGGQLVSQAGGISTVGANTAGQLVKDIPDSFMVVAPDNVGAAAGAKYLCDQGYKNAHVIGSPEIPYTKLIPQYVGDAFGKLCNGKVTSEDSYKIGQTDFGPQLTKIRNADPKPDVIYSPIFVPDSGAFIKQLRGAGIDTPFVTTDGNDSKLFADSGGSAVDGTVFSTHGFPEGDNPTAKFVQEYEATGKKLESNTIEAMGRDNVYALAQAAKQAGSADPKKVLDAVLKLKDFQLATGKVTMDAKSRLPIKEVTLVKMDGKKFTFLETFTPEYIPAP